MLEETVNNAIADRKNMLLERQHDTSQHNQYEMEKAKIMPIGTISNGKKKVAEGKWVSIAEKRTPPTQNKKSESTSKVEEKKGEKYKMPSHVSNQHLGTLRHIKSLVGKKEFANAHKLADSLPDDVKHEIPSTIWEDMVKHSAEADLKEAEEKKKIDSQPFMANPKGKDSVKKEKTDKKLAKK